MSRDGRISIAIDVDGKQVEQGRKSVQGLEGDARKVKGGSDTASKGIKDIAVSLGLVKIGAAVFKFLAQSMDAAISRFDTFTTFPKVMTALGESTEDSDRAINKLSGGIDGLPTKLDDIVTTTQRMYSTFKNLDESTDTALALNNALLASGASASDAQRGTDQYIQSLQKGKFELEEWKTLQETMPIGLALIAESFGMTERQLKAALDSGEISMDQFNDKMIELGTGSGALADLAKKNSQTVATALINLRNTASRGLADIIQAFSDMVENVSGRTLYESLEALKKVVNNVFKAISSTIKALTPVIIAMVNAFKTVRRVTEPLEPILHGLVGAYTALLVIQKVKSAVEDSRKAWDLMSGTIKKITVLTQSKTVAELANVNVQAKYIAANLASLKGLTAKNVILGLLTGQLTLSTAATLLKAKAVVILNGALTFLTGPIGWVVAGIGLLVAAGAGLIKWLNRSTEEGKKLAKQTEALGESTDELTGRVDSNTSSYEKQIRRTEASAEANIDLARKIGELSAQEDLSSKQKKELQDDIELLNNQVEGLNVAYDEEAKALNMSSEEMQKRIELMAEEEKLIVARERQLEISKEQHEIELQLKDIIALREHYHDQMENGPLGHKEYKDAVAELDEQEKALNDTLEILAVQYNVTEEAIEEAMTNRHAVAETITGEQIILYENLSDSLKNTVDSMRDSYQSLEEAATNAFNKIDTESEHTMGSMIENLRHNQEAVAQWGQNQADLLEWAGKEGYDNFIPYIESLSIDSAAELAVLANATEDELHVFAQDMEKGGATSKEAFLTAHNMSNEDYNAVKHLITGTATALTDEIKKADFANIGKDVTDGMTKGIKDNSSDAIDAAGNMADDMTKKTQNTLQIKSPSRIFTNIGKDTVGGLALGILDNIKTVTNAITRLALQMPPIFDFMPGKFTQIGQQIMSGLDVGLASGEGQVLARARSIANAVTATMQSALKIKSPSGVMRDDVGRWIPEGLADGIDNNENAVTKSLRSMYDKMINLDVPNFALPNANMLIRHSVVSGDTGSNTFSNLDRFNRGTESISQKTERNLSINIHAETKEPLNEAELLRRARLEAAKAGYEFQF